MSEPRQIVRILLPAILLALTALFPSSAWSIETKAKQAFMIEATTGTILLSKNADEPVPPASLAKLMTAEYVFHLIKTGQLSLDTEFPVSLYAWRTGGAPSHTSTMFAALKSEISVDNLLQGVIVQSANDGCIILAEGISGSEEAFAKKLNERARKIGLKTSYFGNSNGLPNPENKVTMRELVKLSRHIHDDYPQLFPLFSMREFEWNKIKQRNRNPLLWSMDSVDGMKTGYTDNSGYSYVVTAERNGTRLYLAMSGLSSPKERAEEGRKLLEWGFSSFKKRRVFDANEVIGHVAVYGGTDRYLAVASNAPVTVYEDKLNPERISAKIAYEWPLRAPIKKGDKIGQLRLYSGDEELQSAPVYAQNTVGKGSLTSRALDALQELLFFWL